MEIPETCLTSFNLYNRVVFAIFAMKLETQELEFFLNNSNYDNIYHNWKVISEVLKYKANMFLLQVATYIYKSRLLYDATYLH